MNVLGSCIYTQRYYGEWTSSQTWIGIDYYESTVSCCFLNIFLITFFQVSNIESLLFH